MDNWDCEYLSICRLRPTTGLTALGSTGFHENLFPRIKLAHGWNLKLPLPAEPLKRPEARFSESPSNITADPVSGKENRKIKYPMLQGHSEMITEPFSFNQHIIQ
jgi:hypothetical protein